MQLTAEANYLEAVKVGRRLWVYDNLNMHQTVHHKQEGTTTLSPITINEHLK